MTMTVILVVVGVIVVDSTRSGIMRGVGWVGHEPSGVSRPWRVSVHSMRWPQQAYSTRQAGCLSIALDS